MSTKCSACGLYFSAPEASPHQDGSHAGSSELCPNCGTPRTKPAPAARSESNFLSSYLQILRGLIRSPRSFFEGVLQQDPVYENFKGKSAESALHQNPNEARSAIETPLLSMGGLLAFALINGWIGAALNWAWMVLASDYFSPFWNQIKLLGQEVIDIDHPGRSAQWLIWGDQAKTWIFGAGSLIAFPLYTVVQLLVLSFVLYLGALIFGRTPNRPTPTYERTLQIVCYSSASLLLSWIPVLGWFLNPILQFYLAVTAARVFFGVGSFRGTLIVAFPMLLVMFLVAVVLIAIVTLGIAVFSALLPQF